MQGGNAVSVSDIIQKQLNISSPLFDQLCYNTIWTPIFVGRIFYEWKNLAVIRNFSFMNGPVPTIY